ncbi:hypothetical protein [Paraflavitalea speifideaquila]|uniref:hypothetical protein n=1 Tax=Paraflavitalea speifideaquila TaxID=3076558 RepID=UPI0028E320E4|nr:hypothetical protein [Paraflavitalea speifideiaquila]
MEFSPIYEVCSKEFPVMFNEIAIETDDKSFFKSLSLNGAPTFKKENTLEEGFSGMYSLTGIGILKRMSTLLALLSNIR